MVIQASDFTRDEETRSGTFQVNGIQNVDTVEFWRST